MTKGRINLTPRAAEDLEAMLDETKGECVKPTASGLASWIVSRFKEKHFDGQKDAIRRAHFDRRAYLRGILKDIGDDEGLDEALRPLLRENTQKRRKKGQE